MNNRRKRTCSILVVDDDPDYVHIIQTNLEAKGYDVLVAGDGQTAIECATSGEPDLIVLDTEMPSLDGYEVCRRIREFSTVPIIMLAALAGTCHRVKGLYMGADQCMTKPVYIQELVARVRVVLWRAELSRLKGYTPVFQIVGSLDDSSQQQCVFAET